MISDLRNVSYERLVCFQVLLSPFYSNESHDTYSKIGTDVISAPLWKDSKQNNDFILHMVTGYCSFFKLFILFF